MGIRSYIFLLMFFLVIGCDQKNLEYDYYEDGAIHREYYLENGKPNGLVKIYFPNGVLQSTINVVDGRKVGECLVYYETAEIQSVSYYDSNGLLTGEWREYFENGQLAITGHFSNGKKEGKWLEYYENGQKKQEIEYRGELLNGVQKGFYRNGQLGYIGQYNIGEKIDTHINFNEMGDTTKFRLYNSEGVLLTEKEW